MIYIIKNKPYIKVANYYKEVSIDKKGKEFSVIPVKGENTTIEYVDEKEINKTTLEEYYNTKKNSKVETKATKQINSRLKLSELD